MRHNYECFLGNNEYRYNEMLVQVGEYDRMRELPRVCQICGGEACDRHHLHYHSGYGSGHDTSPCIWVCRPCHEYITALHKWSGPYTHASSTYMAWMHWRELTPRYKRGFIWHLRNRTLVREWTIRPSPP